MRKGGGKTKGSVFERDVCRELSLWWTNGERDDVFWRTAGSGGMATNRAKEGKQTAGAYGDITFTDVQGADLLKVCCFELKRGYGQWCMLDLIDKIPATKKATAKPAILVTFWQQAKRSAEDAGVQFPVIIFRRDMRRIGMIGPKTLLLALAPYAGPHRGKKILADIDGEQIFAMSLQEFLNYCSPEYIKELI